MTKVKDLKNILSNLKDDVDVVISNTSFNNKIEVDYVKQLKENGKEYYFIKL